jgi:ABC-2 type transport system ATP-binding protein
MNATIHTRELTKHFGRIAALDGVNLDVEEGSIYALVGANGAGKTTFIKLLMNILRPTAGEATVLGISARHLAGKHFNRIGYVSENQEMPGWMTVAAWMEYWRPFYPQWDRELEQQLINQFELPLKRRLKDLSRGMRMKAAFASSLAYRPALIVLDEPFSGLDPLVRDELIEGLLDRAPESTIFLSSHDLAEIESFASHVGYLAEGKMLFSEEMASLSNRFRDVTVTLDGPATLPAVAPPDWLQLQANGALVHFVHSGYAGEPSEHAIQAAFPTARSFSFDPMPLRSIFLAIAKSERNHLPTAASDEQQRRSVA